MRVSRVPSSKTPIPFQRFLSSPTPTLTPHPTFSLLKRPTPCSRSFAFLPRRFSPNRHPFAQTPIAAGYFPSSIRVWVKVSAMSTGAGAGAGTDLIEFALSPTSSLKIQKGDITQWFVDGSSDAIVNAANERMLGGGGVDGAIHRAAGPELKEACAKVREVCPGVRCPTGEARITPGFRLPASHVIHTVGPIYDTDKNPAESLTNAYRKSLHVAKENNIQYVAFPAISCGVFRYPFDEAAKIAISTIKELANDFKEVHFVLFSDDIYNVWMEKAKAIMGN